MKISAVVLTHNESDNIEKCLQSVNFADEIIFIDNSIDNTIEKAKKIVSQKKLRIYNNAERQDFAALRNFGLSKAKNDWVLFVDADEAVSQKLQNEITEKITNPSISGYYLIRRDLFLGRWLKYGETGNIRLLKLARKNGGIWQRKVHETWRISGLTATLDNELLHYPHPTIAEFLSRINRWTTLDAKVFYKERKQVSIFSIFLYPLGKFILNYLLRLGFLDGMQGLIFALMMGFHSFLTRAKLYLLINKTA